MGIFREIPPTAGFPLYWKDLLSIFRIRSRDKCIGDDFKEYLNVSYARVTNSGTSAFYLILESLKKISSRHTVVIPSYICPLIPLAIKRAGLRVEVCDIRKDNFNFDLQSLEDICSKNSDILAVVAVHLAGIPVDFDAIENIAKKHGIFIIEDCAQSLGAIYKGKKVGTLGDFSFFSLCRGKGITTYEGGVIVTGRQEYASVIDSTVEQFVKNDFLSEAILTLLLFGYWIFYRPLLFWFVFRLPQIYWNWRGDKIKAAMEDFDINFPIHNMSTIRQLIGHAQFYRLEKEIDRQRQKAAFYMSRLKKIKGIKIIKELPDSRATYPFVTLIFDNPEKRERALKIFGNTEFGASIVYAMAIADYDYLNHIVPDRNCSNARYMTDRALTLSTSTFLKDNDLNSIVNIIENL
jgi:dTDP-4-amino-4,6-dideoxygalactose transaminase